jgi:hypothetical protein
MSASLDKGDEVFSQGHTDCIGIGYQLGLDVGWDF